MRQIDLGNNLFATVDDEDYAKLQPYPWYSLVNSNTTYAYSPHYNLMMHRFILDLERLDARLVDHKDGDGLNNQRENLRIATRSQNGFNRSPEEGAYKGVCWDQARNKWKAQIMIDYKRINLGRYDDVIEAAKAYDKAARDMIGEFAYLNFP